MPTSLIVAPSRPLARAPQSGRTAPATGSGGGPVWGLRIDGDQIALVLQNATLPLGGRVGELVVGLPNVTLPFDFSDGLAGFRHHRGVALGAHLSLDLDTLFGHLFARTAGLVSGRAVGGGMVFSGHTEQGARFTVRARVVPDLADSDLVDEPTLLVSLYDLRVYGRTDHPWPLLAGRVFDALEPQWIVEQTLTTVRLAVLRELLSWALTDLGWKLPSLSALGLRAAHVDDGRLELRFSGEVPGDWVTIDASTVDAGQESFERFIEDLELKQHHGAVDRCLQQGQFREAMAAIYRTMEGPLEPGYLAERLIGICATNPVLFDEGDKVCREVLTRSPGYPTALCGLASIAMGRGLMEEAAVHFERLSTALVATAERQDAIAADLTLAESLRAIDAREARAALERILERAPDHEEALEALVRLAAEAGNEAEAQGLYKRLLFAARTPGRTRESGLALARHAMRRGEPQEARVYLEVVLEAVPSDLDARMALADVAARGGDDELAMRTLDEALRQAHPSDGPGLIAVVRAVAERALALGPPQKARARRVLWRTVDTAQATDREVIELGGMALTADAPELAERYAGRVDELSPEWPDGRCLVARSRLARGLREDALEIVLALAERSPSHPETLELLGLCADDGAARERALLALSEAARAASPGEPSGLVNAALGGMYEALALDWDAIGPLEEAVAHLPAARREWKASATRLLALYPRYGMWPKHQALCEAWLEVYTAPSDRVPFLLARGRVALREHGDAAFAAPSLAEAVRLSPKNPEALALYRDALTDLDAQDDLIGVLRRIETVHPDERERVDAKIRLAEIALDMDARGQARATLARLPSWTVDEPRVVQLRARLDNPNWRPPPAPQGASSQRPEATRASAYSAALDAADRGDDEGARAQLDRWLHEHPLDTPGLELARVIGLGSGDQAAVEEATDALLQLTVDRTARVALLEETIGLMPGTQRRFGHLLDRLRGAHAAHPPGEPRPLPSAAQGLLDESERLERALGRAEAAAAAGAWGAADDAVDEVLGVDGDHVAALELKARILYERKRWPPLAEILERLAQLSFDAEQTLNYTLQRAELLAERLGDREAASRVWAQYAEWQPLDDAVFHKLVAHYEDAGRHGELLDLLQSRVDAATEALEASATRSEALMLTTRLAAARRREALLRLNLLDDGEGALLAIEAALEVRPEDPELMETRVRVLAALGRRAECRSQLDELLPLLLDGPLKQELELLRGHR